MENIVPFLAQLPKEKRFAHLSVSPSPVSTTSDPAD